MRITSGDTAGPIIFGGDFNSIVNSRDATGGTPRSDMTSRLMRSCDLIDVWRTPHRNEIDYTFVRAGSCSRIDRILVSKSSREWLRTARHAVNCFSDHKAVIVRMVLSMAGQPYRRGVSRPNVHVLNDEDTYAELSRTWENLVRQWRHYSSWIDWWIECEIGLFSKMANITATQGSSRYNGNVVWRAC